MRFFVLLFLAIIASSGCASRRADPRFTVTPDEYPRVFAAAKDALVAARFELDRVDARAGVITTRPKPTSGLATPWDTEQSSFGKELEDLLNRQYRRVRISFEPAVAADAETLADRRTSSEPLTATVEVTIDRLCRPGWRVDPVSVRLGSFALNPDWTRQGMWPQYAVPFAQDPALAGRLSASIQKRATR